MSVLVGSAHSLAIGSLRCCLAGSLARRLAGSLLVVLLAAWLADYLAGWASEAGEQKIWYAKANGHAASPSTAGETSDGRSSQTTKLTGTPTSQQAHGSTSSGARSRVRQYAAWDDVSGDKFVSVVLDRAMFECWLAWWIRCLGASLVGQLALRLVSLLTCAWPKRSLAGWMVLSAGCLAGRMAACLCESQLVAHCLAGRPICWLAGWPARSVASWLVGWTRDRWRATNTGGKA